MKPPFEKFSVSIDDEYPNRISIYLPGIENFHFGSESAEKCRDFIEAVIREKMEQK